MTKICINISTLLFTIAVNMIRLKFCTKYLLTISNYDIIHITKNRRDMKEAHVLLISAVETFYCADVRSADVIIYICTLT